ncbi:MAG: HIT domain-containing protein [Nanoarchaeota archaeon]
MALTEEDLKKMSPEQLRQLQKQQCIFCHIIAKRVQSKIVYEDDKVLAVLDINPANPGHVLLLPKEHYSVSPQVPDELFAYMGMVAKQMSKALLRTVGAEGSTILAANGMAAGQRASHFIMHVIPRKEGDKVGLMLPPGDITEQQIVQVQKALAPLIAKAFGKEPVAIEEVKEAQKKEAKPEQTPQPKHGPETKKEESAPTTEPAKRPQEPAPPQPQESPSDQGTNLDDITSLLLGGKR